MGKAVSGEKGKTVTFFGGEWHNGDPAVMAGGDTAFRMASVVFDGARAISGRTPDLHQHCQRVLKSAEIMGLKPNIDVDQIVFLAKEGIDKFSRNSELYISPMFFATEGFIIPTSTSAEFVLSIFESPLPEEKGFSACLTQFRRPALNMAPTMAKASCLYPNVARGLREANSKGFDVGVVLDPNGNVAEFSYTNLFMVRDGMVSTPAINGTFLNGITRQRMIKLLRDDGILVTERSINFEELLTASELFGTGNFAKISPCTQIEAKKLKIGPLYLKARELYFDYVGAC